MWHEARRREKATQKLLSDHRKRADKRREENKVDPNSLLQVNGLKSKLCIEPCVYKQALKSLVAWQGDKKVTIDRFDIRATLTSIPSDLDHVDGKMADRSGGSRTVIDADESESMKRLLNYERYRLLINNDLNKISEDLRLKLVARSDVDSDAKMKKLRNNRFGTSGEAYISAINQVNTLLGKPLQHREQTKRKGPTIGPSYNSVPPPTSLTDNTDDGGNIRSRALDIIALDDFDDFELDSVKVPFVESKRVHDTAKKYSMTAEELMLLTSKDSGETKLTLLLKELDKLSQKNKEEELQREQYQQVYGPALPPKLAADNEYQSDSDSRDTQVRQRSPSAAEIPLRNGEYVKNISAIESPESPASIPVSQAEPVGERDVDFINDASNLAANFRESTSGRYNDRTLPTTSSSCCSQKHTDKKHSQQADHADLNQENKTQDELPQNRGRRASTPLIYKRNCRSSRSLSRERRGSSYRPSSHRPTRERRRSRGYSTSSSLSSHRQTRTIRRKRPSRRRRRRR